MKSISEKPSESSVYLWNITASIANAGLSVLILAIATRMLNNNDTDIFSMVDKPVNGNGRHISN